MSSVSNGPRKRKVKWTIRRLLAAASDETPPRRPSQPPVLHNQSATPVPASHHPPRRAPVRPRPSAPAADSDWLQQDFNWPHEEFAPIANDRGRPSSPRNQGEQRNWGMPFVDWGDRNPPRPSPEAVSRPAARSQPRPEAAPARPFHSPPVQHTAPPPAQRCNPEPSRQPHREALAEPLKRPPLPDAKRQVEARDAAKANPDASNTKAAPQRALAPEAAPGRPFHSPPVQGTAPAPTQRRNSEPSRQPHRQALAAPLKRQPLPEAKRQTEARDTAKAKPKASSARAAPLRAPATEAGREEAITEARQKEEAVARARQQFLTKIRRQQAAIRAHLQYALAELRYEAPHPPLLPQPAGVRRARAMVPGQAQQTPPSSQTGHHGVPPNIVSVAIRSMKRAGIAAGLFSLFINILTLAGPLFMMGAYEVAPDSIPSLLVLGGLLLVLYGALALLDALRGMIVKRAADRLDTQLGPATCEALRHRLATGKRIPNGPLRDLASLRQFMSGSGPATFLDLPWAPISLLIITMMHWSLGLITAIAMLVMAAIAVTSEAGTRALLQDARQASEEATSLALESRHDITATGARETADAIRIHWREARQRAETAMRKAGERMSAFASTSMIIRTIMQSVLLAVGMLLLIGQEISSGIMIAVAVISGKALGPVGEAISEWRGLICAHDAFGRLEALHRRYPAQPQRLLPPPPKGRIEVRDLQVTPQDAEIPVLRQIGFTLKGGETLGVIGVGVAGRSALASALAGRGTPNCGWVRLDGADLRMLDPNELGAKVGYLRQAVELSEGTIGENIARFDVNATRDAIVRAAKTAGVHDMIAGLPGRYDFKVGENGSGVSATQRQCLGLARAVFGNPVLVVLDEPADLDAPGKAALDQTMTALKASRTTVILITHRQDALDAVDHILMLEQGKPRVFGKKSKVLGALARKDSKAVSVPAAKASARTMPPNWIAPVLKAVRKAWAAIDKKWIRMRRRSP